MTRQYYEHCFRQHQQLATQFYTLLKSMVVHLGGIKFESFPQIPIQSSNGEWYGVSVSRLAVADDGYLAVTDAGGDVYYKKELDSDACLILISEITEQFGWQQAE